MTREVSQTSYDLFFINRFYHPDISATSQLLTELAEGLASQGLRVQVISSRSYYDWDRGRIPQASERVNGVEVRRIWSTNFGRASIWGRTLDYLSFYVSSFFAMLWCLRRGDTVVAASDPPLLSLFALVAARLRGARQINWLHDLFPEVAGAAGFGLARGRIGGLLSRLRNVSLRQSHTNVVIGQRMADCLQAEGIPAAKLRLIHNWALSNIHPVPRAANPLRKQWGLGNSFVVGYSGNLGFAHEFDTVLEAAELLREHHTVVFLFIGGGKHTPEFQEQLRARGLTNFVFKPYQPLERLPESLGVSDIHLVSLLPAYEGLVVPSKFYGIAAANRPVIAIGDPNGEIGTLTRKSGGGFAIAPNEPQMLADAIVQCLRSPELCERMGQALANHHGKPQRLNHVIEQWSLVLGAQVEPGSEVSRTRR